MDWEDFAKPRKPNRQSIDYLTDTQFPSLFPQPTPGPDFPALFRESLAGMPSPMTEPPTFQGRPIPPSFAEILGVAGGLTPEEEAIISKLFVETRTNPYPSQIEPIDFNSPVNILERTRYAVDDAAHPGQIIAVMREAMGRQPSEQLDAMNFKYSQDFMNAYEDPYDEGIVRRLNRLQTRPIGKRFWSNLPLETKVAQRNLVVDEMKRRANDLVDERLMLEELRGGQEPESFGRFTISSPSERLIPTKQPSFLQRLMQQHPVLHTGKLVTSPATAGGTLDMLQAVSRAIPRRLFRGRL